MMIGTTEIIWAQASYLPLAVIFMVLTSGVLIARYRRQKRVSNSLVSPTWRAILLPRFSSRRLIVKMILSCVGMLGLAVSLLRPQWYEAQKQIAQEGREVMIALDISRSMLASDVAPSRLECAKKKIRSLMHTLDCERIGLIVFAGSAFVLCPLTSDFTAFASFLDQIDHHSIAAGTTSVDVALAKTLEIYERMPTKKTKLLVIFTDGEDFSSNLAALKKRAQEQHLHIFAVGVGTSEGAPIPLFDPQGKRVGHVKDKQGKVVISQLNEGILRSLAHDVGGIYIHARGDGDTDIDQITQWVRGFEKEQLGNADVSRYEDQYPWFVAISFISFLLEWII